MYTDLDGSGKVVQKEGCKHNRPPLWCERRRLCSRGQDSTVMRYWAAAHALTSVQDTACNLHAVAAGGRHWGTP
jgi:hypothetical protein